MEPSQSQVLSEPLLAAKPQLKEKPCLGVRTSNPAPHPGHFICNSRTAIGLRFGCSGTASDPVEAPSNAKRPDQKSCGGIIATGVIQTGLDALGGVPGEAFVSLTAKGALAGSQVLAGYASTTIFIVGGSKTGIALGATGSTLTLAALATDGVKGAAELIPGIGQAVAVVSSVFDVAATVRNYGGCKGWWGGADW